MYSFYNCEGGLFIYVWIFFFDVFCNIWDYIDNMCIVVCLIVVVVLMVFLLGGNVNYGWIGIYLVFG